MGLKRSITLNHSSLPDTTIILLKGLVFVLQNGFETHGRCLPPKTVSLRIFSESESSPDFYKYNSVSLETFLKS